MLIAALATYGTFVYWRSTRQKLAAPAVRNVAVIVPIKGTVGEEDRIQGFLAGLLAQEGAEYRLIVAVEAEDDPAAGIVARHQPVATIMGDFYRAIETNKRAHYPAEELASQRRSPRSRSVARKAR